MVRWSLAVFILLSMAIWIIPFSVASRVPLDLDNHEFVLIYLLLSSISMVCIAFGASEFQSPASCCFALPISTKKIVAWKLVLPCITSGVIVAVTFSIAGFLYKIHLPILGVSLFAATISAPLVMISNARGTHSIERFGLGISIILALLYWLTGRYGEPLSTPTHLWKHVTSLEIVTMACAVAVTIVLYARSVTADRCGEPGYSQIHKFVLSRSTSFRTSGTQSSMPAFRSPSHAQFWYEYRQKGATFPSVVALVVSIYLVPLPIYLIGNWIVGPLLPHVTIPFVVSGIYAAFWVLALNFATFGVFAGCFIGIADFSGKKRRQESSIVESINNLDAIKMGGFQATLPIGPMSYSRAIYRAIAQSIFIVWATWAILFVVFHLAMSLLNLPATFQDSSVVDSVGWWFISFTILGPWITAANFASIGLTGRPRVVFVASLSAIVLFFGILLLAPAADAMNPNVAERTMSIVATSIIFVTIFVFAKASQAKLINAQYILMIGLGSFAIVSMWAFIAPIQLAPIAYLYISAFAALVVLPLATIPLAFAWNRHR